MAADLITRIILDDKQFNDKLEKTKKALNITGSVTKGASSAIKGMAGQLAAAAGAYELMNTAVNSNAVTQRLWNDTMGTAKESVNSFFTSLSTGDWSVFEGGIMNAIRLSKNYIKALREVKKGLQMTDVKLSLGEKDLNEWENIAMDKSLSKTDRESGFANFEKAYQEHSAYIEEASENAYSRLMTMLKGKGVTGVDNAKELRKLILDYQNPLTSKNSDLQRYIELMSVRSSKLTKEKRIELQKHRAGDDAFSGNKRVEEYIQKVKEETAEVDQLIKKYPELEKARKIDANFGTDEKMGELLDILDKIIGYQDRMSSMTRQFQGLSADFKGGKLISDSPGKTISQSPAGSLSGLSQKISDIKLRIGLAVDPESRAALYEELKALEEEKRVIEFQYKHPNGPGRVSERGGSLADLAVKPSMTKQLDKIFSPKSTKNVSKYAKSIQLVAESVSSLSSNFNSGAAAGLQYFAAVAGGAVQAATAIAALIPVKEAESQANAKNAITGAAASQAAIPFVGPILAAAAVASLIAVMLNIPKFAHGGIVPGTSFSGDRVPVLANSGEMILNAAQQKNLFGLINGGGGSSVGGGGKVKFEIEGKKLVGVISNYNKQRNKII